jgi:hypothetical protein
LVLGAATRYASSLQGPAVALTDVSLAQGAYFALERLTVSNEGESSFPSFSVTTSDAPTSAFYCYTLTDPSTLMVVASTCPLLAANPRTLAVSHGLTPGSSVTVTLQMPGTVFTVGSLVLVTVLTPAGASASLQANVLPA